MPIDAKTSGPFTIDSGVVSITDNSNWVLVCLLQLAGGKKDALLNLLTSVGSLTHLKLTRAATPGGVHMDWLVDADFNTATNELLDVLISTGASPPNIYEMASGNSAQIKLGELKAIQEIAVWAKATGSALHITGTIN